MPQSNDESITKLISTSTEKDKKIEGIYKGKSCKILYNPPFPWQAKAGDNHTIVILQRSQIIHITSD